MADYQLTGPMSGGMIIRTEDAACIPPDPANSDYAEYLQWVEGGGVPDPYVEPEPVPPQPSAEQSLLYDHENRIRFMEGEPPIELDDFLDKMKGG
jgi:hypothetical protein